MTVEQRDGSNGSSYTVATECPYCGEEILKGRGVAQHFATDCTEVSR